MTPPEPQTPDVPQMKPREVNIQFTKEQTDYIDVLMARINRVRSGELTGTRCVHGYDTTVCPLKGCGDDEEELITSLLDTLATPRPTEQPAIVGGVDQGITQDDRIAAADLLDWVAEALDHNGIGQVADLIRDGEYDEHEATNAFAKHRIAALTARPSAPAEVERLMHVIDRDRYVVAHCIGAITDAIRGRAWLLEGRGPYEWDDDRYREEFADAVKAIEEAVQPLRIVGWDKSDCTRIEERVNAAKLAAREMLSKPLGPRGMIEADIFGDPRDAEIDRLRSLLATPAPVEPGSEREALAKALCDHFDEDWSPDGNRQDWLDAADVGLAALARPAADDAK